jgi:stearoyl-CoA desaturase (delta-9 desaturase)
LALGFTIDPSGNRRRVDWTSVVVIGMLLPGFSLWAIYRIFTTPTSPGLWALTLGLYVFTLFGVTLGNHRYWTHRGFQARLPLQIVLAIASAMSVQGSIQQWVLTHRAHHRYAEVIGWDPHSPYEYSAWRGYKGLLWAQGVWLMFHSNPALQLAVHHDLARDRVVQVQQKAFGAIAAGQYVLLLAFYPIFGWNAVLVAGVLRTAALMTSTGMVNSVCHKWGTRATDSLGREYRRDDSRNNVVVAVLAGGEGNHSWHHADPTCPRHGRTVVLDPEARRAGLRPARGWRPDATWRLIQVLHRLRLVHDLKLPRTTVHFPAALCVPTPSLLRTHEEWQVPEPEPATRRS